MRVTGARGFDAQGRQACCNVQRPECKKAFNEHAEKDVDDDGDDDVDDDGDDNGSETLRRC